MTLGPAGKRARGKRAPPRERCDRPREHRLIVRVSWPPKVFAAICPRPSRALPNRPRAPPEKRAKLARRPCRSAACRPRNPLVIGRLRNRGRLRRRSSFLERPSRCGARDVEEAEAVGPIAICRRRDDSRDRPPNRAAGRRSTGSCQHQAAPPTGSAADRLRRSCPANPVGMRRTTRRCRRRSLEDGRSSPPLRPRHRHHPRLRAAPGAPTRIPDGNRRQGDDLWPAATGRSPSPSIVCTRDDRDVVRRRPDQPCEHPARLRFIEECSARRPRIALRSAPRRPPLRSRRLSGDILAQSR